MINDKRIKMFRRWLAKKLVKLAYIIHKESPEVQKFWFSLMEEQAISNQAITLVDLKSFYEEPKTEETEK